MSLSSQHFVDKRLNKERYGNFENHKSSEIVDEEEYSD